MPRAILWRVLIPIAVITFVNALDRMNVSFAGAAMSRDLGLTPSTFGTGISAFFVAYLLFQYPHAWLLRRIGIRPWLLVSMILWGVAGVLMSRAQNLSDFVVARFLLGLAEAGLAPGMTWFIAQWTPRGTRARAMAVTLAAVPLALVMGGPLCGGLLGMSNPLGIAGWRWMFLIGALPNFACAIAAAFWFVDRPRDARWLAPGEGERLETQIAAEGSMSSTCAPADTNNAWRDGRLWLCASAWFLVMTGAYALVYWLPQIVRRLELAESEWLIGTLSALPQAGLALGLYVNARHSDHRGERLWHTAAGALLAGIALAAALALPAGIAVLGLLVIAGFGLGAAQGVFWTLPPAFRIGGGSVPVGAIAAISMAGTAGGIVGPAMLGRVLEITGSAAPGIAVLAGLLLLAALLLASLGRRYVEVSGVR